MKYKLKDLAVIKRGASPRPINEYVSEKGYPWLKISDFSLNDKFVYKTKEFIIEAGLKKTRYVKSGTLIVTNSATPGIPIFLMKDMCLHDGFLYFESISPKIDKEYLYYFILNNRSKLIKLGNGSVFVNLKKEILENYEIELPSIDVQHKIARYLSAIDEKIKLNNEINDNLLNQIDSHFRELYIDFEQNNGRIPANFRYGILDELSKEIICGKTPSTKNESYYGGNIPFITIPDMHDKVYVIKTERYLSEEGANSQIKKFLPRNSICVSCIGTAGLVALVNESSHTNQQINSIIPKENVSPYYVYSLMKTLKDKIISLGQCGSTIVNLNKVQFSKLEVLIPTEQSMSEFDQRVKPMFEQINLLQLENEKLSSLRDSLLPKLMSGEIDVDSIEL